MHAVYAMAVLAPSRHVSSIGSPELDMVEALDSKAVCEQRDPSHLIIILLVANEADVSKCSTYPFEG